MMYGRFINRRMGMGLALAAAIVLSAVAVLQAQPAADAKAAPQAAEAPAADAHGDSHASDKLATDPMAIDVDLAIFTFVVFVLLLAVLKKFAWGPILDGLDKREQKIADNIAAAEASQAEAARLLKDYEAKVGKAHEDVRAILDEARRDAEHTKQEIVTAARSEASAEVARGKREIETARDQALQELMQTSANLAVDLASKIIQAKLTPSEHAKLIEESLSKFPAPSRN